MTNPAEILNDHWAEARNSILRTILDGTHTSSGIREAHLDLTTQHVSVTLSRLVKSGEIVRVYRGYYVPNRHR